VPLFGCIWFEALTLAILLGAVVRTLWSPGNRWFAGVNFSATTLLEAAVLLLGSAVSGQAMRAIGPVPLLGALLPSC
jgi:uncharacterized membrane protein YadS